APPCGPSWSAEGRWRSRLSENLTVRGTLNTSHVGRTANIALRHSESLLHYVVATLGIVAVGPVRVPRQSVRTGHKQNSSAPFGCLKEINAHAYHWQIGRPTGARQPPGDRRMRRALVITSLALTVLGCERAPAPVPTQVVNRAGDEAA